MKALPVLGLSSGEEFWTELKELFQHEVAGIAVGDLLASFGLVLFAYFLRRVLAHWLFAGLRRLASKTKTEWDDEVLNCLERPLASFILVLGVYLAHLQLELGDDADRFALNAFQIATIILAFWATLRLTDVISNIFTQLSNRRGHSIGAFMPLINKATRTFLILLCLVLIVQNLGYNIGTLLGALGIGGAAFAFAAKDTIANLYGSMALALDRPFKVGDWIMVGDRVDGDVEEIGLRSTKVRSWPKTQLSIPNHILANEIINNWSRMPKRRVKQVVGVTYESKPDDVEALVEDIRKLLREDEGVQQDFILVNFIDFGESSLDILVYYFTTTIKWLEHMDIRQRVNLKIMRAVEARGLSVAFPTRSIQFQGELAEKIAGFKLPDDHGPSTPP